MTERICSKEASHSVDAGNGTHRPYEGIEASTLRRSAAGGLALMVTLANLSSCGARVESLGHHRAQSEAVPSTEKRCDDGSPGSRQEGVSAEALGPTQGLVERERCFATLGRLFREQAVHALLAFLGHDDPWVRRETIYILQRTAGFGGFGGLRGTQYSICA
jgi:hypothetical protein